MIHWFLDSLANQSRNHDLSNVILLVVDFYAELTGRREAITSLFNKSFSLEGSHAPKELRVVTPKPSVWQGPHRLTTQDYFAAANARNTAICLAPDGYICFVDDLSVPMPGWLDAVMEATTRNKVTLGAYKKVKELTVEPGTGVVTHYVEHEQGNDIRMRGLRGNPPYPCSCQWHFGCSLVAPVEAYLSINGWPEGCDGMGYEDSVCGSALERQGWHFVYDTRMMTWESEEHHHIGRQMRRIDKGKSPHDKSHAMLKMYQNAKWFDNYFGDEKLRGLRQRVLAGDPFPILQHPQHDWYDAQPLSEM